MPKLKTTQKTKAIDIPIQEEKEEAPKATVQQKANPTPKAYKPQQEEITTDPTYNV
jgi:hypothetical protein